MPCIGWTAPLGLGKSIDMPTDALRRRAGRIFRILAGGPSDTMLGRFRRRYPPFPILIGTILSARSRDEMTERVTGRVMRRWPTPARLARAPTAALRRILRPIGFYRQKARAIRGAARGILTRFGGRVPSSFEELQSLPGVGRKVAGCVRVYAFGLEAIPADTHVHRISNRLGLVSTRKPEETEQALMRIVPRPLWPVVNDTLVSHGKRVCRPIGPRCPACVLRRLCRWPGRLASTPPSTTARRAPRHTGAGRRARSSGPSA